MNSILSLQMMEPTGFEMVGQQVDGLMDSTSSYEGCACSTNSWSACPATQLAITQ
jgi:hypothetical protein